MKKFIMALPIWVVALLLVLFVVSNRHAVSVSLYPTNLSLDVPLYLVFFMGLFLGLLLSGFVLMLRRVNAATKIYLANKENARLKSKVVDMEKALDEPSSNVEDNEQLSLAKSDIHK